MFPDRQLQSVGGFDAFPGEVHVLHYLRLFLGWNWVESTPKAV
jgi:hypothetical protein